MSIKVKVFDSPAGWFGVLQRAVENGDVEQAAEAKKELNRLGFTVDLLRYPDISPEESAREECRSWKKYCDKLSVQAKTLRSENRELRKEIQRLRQIAEQK